MRMAVLSGLGLRSWPLSAVVLVLLGCASTTQMFDGPPLPPEQVAMLRGSGGVRRVTIDGKDPGGSRWLLMPGQHEVKLSVRAISLDFVAWFPCVLYFRAVAGHEYRLESESTPMPPVGRIGGIKSAYAVLRDLGTGDTVTCTAWKDGVGYH